MIVCVMDQSRSFLVGIFITPVHSEPLVKSKGSCKDVHDARMFLQVFCAFTNIFILLGINSPFEENVSQTHKPVCYH